MQSQYLRKAEVQDEARLFEWINEADARKNALHQHQITLKEHREWFLNKLYSNDCQIYILMENEQSIGQIRIELIRESTRITYSIDKQFRGMGYGKLLLYLMLQAVEYDFPLWNTFYAEVKKDNAASQRVFEDSGFSIQEEDNDILLYAAEKSRIKMNLPEIYRGGVLLLSNNRNSFMLYEWLLGCETKLHFYSGKINSNLLKNMNPEYIVSYNYNFIVSGEIIEQFSGRIYNLHISYLPWNRGFSPNFWSFIDNTPKGVTIHEMSEGLDTGKLIVQKELFFDEEEESFESSYGKLNQEILGLFQENWQLIKVGKIQGREQEQNVGSYHSKKDLIEFTKDIEFDWSLGIKEFKLMLGIER